MIGRVLAVAASIAVLALAGCGGGGSTTGTASSARGAQQTSPPRLAPGTPPASYGPGDSRCRAVQAPGTVAEIGEDVIGTPVPAFVACFGPPLRERRNEGRRCLYYRARENRTYWQFCIRDGRIVSGLGSLPRPAPR